MKYVSGFIWKLGINFAVFIKWIGETWWNNRLLLLWSSRYGCNNGRYGCTIVMSYIEINKAVSQWLLTFNLCVSVTWPLTCAFHMPCTHTPKIIDMHRGMCDNALYFCTTCYHPWKYLPISLYNEQAIIYNWWPKESHLLRIYQFKTITPLLPGICRCNLKSGIFYYIPNINTLSISCVIATKWIPSQDLTGD